MTKNNNGTKEKNDPQPEMEPSADTFGNTEKKGNDPSGIGFQTPLPSVEDLRLSQSFDENLKIRKLLKILVRKPGKQQWVRTHPDQDYEMRVSTLELVEQNETYLVAPSLHDELGNEVRPVHLFLYMTRQWDLGFWPIVAKGQDGTWNSWHQSAHEAAHMNIAVLQPF
jgi:hypothetical protein